MIENRNETPCSYYKRIMAAFFTHRVFYHPVETGNKRNFRQKNELTGH